MKKILLLMAFMSFTIIACGDYKDEPKNLAQDSIREMVFTNLTSYKRLPRGLHQAMAVYNDYILLFTFDKNDAAQPAKAYLYQLSTSQLLATLTLPNNKYKRPHCNAASFSNIFKSANSIMPLLYVSQWDEDSEKGCFVYDITLINGLYNMDLVQTILPTNVSTTIRGSGQTDWVVDPFGVIYSIGYHIKDGAHILANNKTIITKYKLPLISDGSVVTFSDTDVLDHFELPIFIYRQDLCFENGYILMLAGVRNNSESRRLVLINPSTQSISSLFSLDFINEEPEGIGVSYDKLLIGFRDDIVIYQLESQ